MAVYHQMGHDSENLMAEVGLAEFKGVILSPVNYSQYEVDQQVIAAREELNIEAIFDPQLYVPNSERGHLRDWPYFPSDVDTADLSSDQWWGQTVRKLVDTCTPMRPNAICSPCALPRTYSDEYFMSLVKVCSTLADSLSGTDIQAIQTAVVGTGDLASRERVLTIASILSQTTSDRIYLVLVSNLEPRRELSDVEEIKGVMRLISELQASGLRILVGFCSSDVVLWKHAGASDCASGKFFNLRRFTRARFEEPMGGGGQLPYWLEENLVAFIRESDLIRIRRANLLSEASLRNPFGREILNQMDNSPGLAWLAKSWRQYLWWFADIEQRIERGQVSTPLLLKSSENVWKDIEDQILMEEARNDGAWLRAWRRACIEYKQP